VYNFQGFFGFDYDPALDTVFLLSRLILAHKNHGFMGAKGQFPIVDVKASEMQTPQAQAIGSEVRGLVSIHVSFDKI
jgi:hypothetical protein